ncbi:FAD-dependent oxidoreductase, partial [Olegusella massiliensis]|uniref:FAD-dependent oxidoreductase n=1 Tax=Olegusella massiliensis TaxID=1776381 RepID=UPI0023FA3C4F
MGIAMRDCDVLVIGAGIAGTTAALAAANTGARVILASTVHIFSGSSFFGGTWGLGLIGPQDISDEAELTQTILSIGRGMAVPTLVTQLVKGIEPAVRQLESRGVHLRHAQAAEQQEFIPCFDHKQRSWQGL